MAADPLPMPTEPLPARELLAALSELIPAPLFVKDLEGRYLDCNGAFEAFLGRPRSRIVGSTAFDLAPQGLAQVYDFQDKVLSEAQGSQVYESQVSLPDGTVHDVVFHKAIFHAKEGRPAGLVGLILDVTDRRILELEFARLNRLYNLLSRMGQCLVQVGNRQELLDRSCAIAVEEGAYPLVWIAWKGPGGPEVKALARSGPGSEGWAEDIARLLQRPEGSGLCTKCLEEGRTVVFHDYDASPAGSGTKAWIAASGLRSGMAVPIRFRDVTVGAFLAYSREVPAFPEREVDLLEKAVASLAFGLERFKVEEEKILLLEQLHHAQKLDSLGNLAGGIAHDMNNVLGAILALGSAHLELMAPGDPMRNPLDTIVKAARRGGEMVKGLLAFARKTQPPEGRVDLHALAREVAALIERTSLARVRIELDLKAKHPTLRGEASALSQALMNLCVNALDAMEGGGTLTLATRDQEGELLLTVRDTGGGMAPDVLRQAMDPFFTTKPQGKGTGLGLSIVYGVMRAHKGEVLIHSRPGAGTEVLLRFPTTLPAAPPAPGPPQAPPAPPLPVLDVLVVDDDEFLRAALGTALTALGSRFQCVSSGEAALERLRTGEVPGLILLDLNMPGLGGAQTLHGIRALDTNVPVLVVTGKADGAARAITRTFPRVGLLPKPFSTQDLRSRVAALLEETP